MFDKYLKILHRMFEVMTNLSSSDVTVNDYLNVIGYEFMVLSIGLLYILAIAFLILSPIGISLLINKRLDRPLKEYSLAFNAFRKDWNDFCDKYNSTMEKLKKVEKDERNNVYKELLDMLDSKKISHSILKNGIKYESVKKNSPDFSKIHIYSRYDDLSKVPEEFKKSLDTGKYKSYNNMYCSIRRKKIIFIILWIILYLMFTIPLVFIIIG